MKEESPSLKAGECQIDYIQDIRCLAVGEHIWAMARQGASWKANAQTISYQVIDVPPILQEQTQRAMVHFKADVLGLDFLQTRAENYHLLESNDTPGFSGFPDEVRKAVARQVREKLERYLGDTNPFNPASLPASCLDFAQPKIARQHSARL